jgi:OTU domain-containing protein 3
MSYIEEHRDEFEPFMEDDEPFDTYVHRMRNEKEWGGHQELFAASQLFKVSVVICGVSVESSCGFPCRNPV